MGNHDPYSDDAQQVPDGWGFPVILVGLKAGCCTV